MTRAEHCKVMRELLKRKRDLGEVKDTRFTKENASEMGKRGNREDKARAGAMSKRGIDMDLYSRFKEYMSLNPDAKKIQISRDLGISRPTVDKYLKILNLEGYYMKVLRDRKEIEIEIKDDGTVYGIDTDGSRITYDKFNFQDLYTEGSVKYYLTYAGVYPEVRVPSLYDSPKPKRKCYATFFLSREQAIELLSRGIKIDGLMLRDEKLVTSVCYNHVYIEV